ncbi:MAG: universal stress protein, partial [Acidimicrobiia bacterium]|nr:universal stress protein [Acidimicrobiia bacterium]
MPKRIVVPLDRSDFAESALPYALGLLDAGGSLALVSAIDPMIDPMGGIPNLEMILEESAQSYLTETQSRLPDGAQTTTHVVTGSPVLSIKHFSEGCGADLIVLSTHGRGPLSRVWLGSVADGLLRRTSIPVLLIRPHESGDPDLTQPVDLPRRVTVAYDGSELAEQLLDRLDLLGDDPETLFD